MLPDWGGPIFGGAYRWRGLFSEFYGIIFYRYHLSAFVLMVTCSAGLEGGAGGQNLYHVNKFSLLSISIVLESFYLLKCIFYFEKFPT